MVISPRHPVGTTEIPVPVDAEVAAAGATITRPASETPWGGYVGYFTDLDGHAWEITHASMLDLTDDGFLSLPD